MKNSITTLTYSIGISLFLSSASGQNLPNKQEKSSWQTVVNVNSHTEDNSYQAYNKATEIFYTIANNDENIILELKAEKPIIIQKIVSQRISFILTDLTGSQKTLPLAVKFPLLSMNDRQLVIHCIKSKELKEIKDTSVISHKKDSMAYLLNNKVTVNAKELLVNNSATFKDSLVSIYNELGFKAACYFTKNLAYVCKLVIPLKQLSSSKTTLVNKVKYQIMLNGATENGVAVRLTSDGRGIIKNSAGQMAVVVDVTPDTMTLNFPTDVSGEYLLAKKH